MSKAIEEIKHPTPGVWTELASSTHIKEQSGQHLGSSSQQMLFDAPFSLAVKANIGVAGFARSAGCMALSDTPVSADAPVVASLRSAGAVVVGTTNMHELAFGITSNNASFGQVPLPGHPDHGAGGSSGGSAAAVAEGSVDIALGTDTGGSISIPASHCGVFGFRPSTGRWPGAGIVGLSWTRDTPGVFARTPSAISRLDNWMTNDSLSPLPNKRLRLGVPTQFMEDLDPHTEKKFTSALANLAPNLDLVKVDYSPVLEATSVAEMPIVLWESKQLLSGVAGRAFNTSPTSAFAELAERVSSEDVAQLLQSQLSGPVKSDEYQEAQRQVLKARFSYVETLKAHRLDALIFPSTPAPAPPQKTTECVHHNGREENAFSLYTGHTGQGTILGAPMFTVPLVGESEELPVGATIQGPRFADAALIATATQISKWVTK